ncbi:helix-turn-helix domain-containing protein [Peptostreptococcus faecalis]|uniref:helix-turn-helix domain-containing protein n=1 Tax=Peptostreptococcus faecalis TaxID=2045015 RepID=UPI000C7D8B8E|nr:helix-turn-helix transcriptional regulator [Peptostreptococcus faecalis]
MEVYEKIKLARRNAGLTQRELAEMTGFSRGYIATIEIGKHIPSDDTLTKISEATNTLIINDGSELSLPKMKEVLMEDKEKIISLLEFKIRVLENVIEEKDRKIAELSDVYEDRPF